MEHLAGLRDTEASEILSRHCAVHEVLEVSDRSDKTFA
jgi:hypothetical protein